MKYFSIIFYFSISVQSFCYEPVFFDLIRKSRYELVREMFEAKLGDLTDYDFLLIFPDSPQISAVKITNNDKIVRKYWRLGLAGDQVMIQEFNGINIIEFEKTIGKIFDVYADKSEDSLDAARLILFSKGAGEHTWKYVRFAPGIKSEQLKILYDVMIPTEDIPNPKDFEEFLEGITE